MVNKNQIRVFKISGSVLERKPNLEHVLSQLKKLQDKEPANTICLIPGGGSLANFVRYVDRKQNLGDDLSHWMAIQAMEYNGIKLCENYNYLLPVKDVKILLENDPMMAVFLPHEYLKKTDELPHSWEVTSDSITLFIAFKLGIDHCFLIKEVEGILDSHHNLVKEINFTNFKKLKATRELAEFSQGGHFSHDKKKTQPVDSYIFNLMKSRELYCIILSGNKSSNSISNYFNASLSPQQKRYTKITFD